MIKLYCIIFLNAWWNSKSKSWSIYRGKTHFHFSFYLLLPGNFCNLSHSYTHSHARTHINRRSSTKWLKHCLNTSSEKGEYILLHIIQEHCKAQKYISTLSLTHTHPSTHTHTTRTHTCSYTHSQRITPTHTQTDTHTHTHTHRLNNWDRRLRSFWLEAIDTSG